MRHPRSGEHGHSELVLQIPGLPKPLVVVGAHLSPWSAATAAQEAQLLLGRAHREGGLGVLGGDLNHLPLADPEPDWTRVSAANRAARTVASDPVLRGDRSVGLVLARGDLVDTAAHLADQREDPSLRAVTGHAGLIRTDQIHVTRALLPALVDYQRIETGRSAITTPSSSRSTPAGLRPPQPQAAIPAPSGTIDGSQSGLPGSGGSGLFDRRDVRGEATTRSPLEVVDQRSRIARVRLAGVNGYEA